MTISSRVATGHHATIAAFVAVILVLAGCGSTGSSAGSHQSDDTITPSQAAREWDRQMQQDQQLQQLQQNLDNQMGGE